MALTSAPDSPVGALRHSSQAQNPERGVLRPLSRPTLGFLKPDRRF